MNQPNENQLQLSQTFFKDIPVLTTKQLAEFYGVTEQIIKQNFNYNKSNYIENVDYFLLKDTTLKEFKRQVENLDLVSKFSSELYLWTESGSLKHSKSIGTSEAWNVHNKLVDSYFKLKELSQQHKQIPKTFADALRAYADEVEKTELLQKQIESEKPQVEGYKAFLDTSNLMSIGDFAKLCYEKFGLGRNKLFEMLRTMKILMRNNVPYQEFISNEYFKIKEFVVTHKDFSETKHQTFLTKSGVEWLFNKLKEKIDLTK